MPVDRENTLLEAQTRALMHSIALAIIVIDQEGEILSFNPAAEQSFQWREQDLIGKHFSTLFPVSSDPFIRGSFLYLDPEEWAEAISRPIEVEGKRKDGSYFPLEITLNRVAQGDQFLYTATGIDITARKQTADALKSSEQKFMNIFYKSVDATLLIDGEKFVDCNDSTVKMLRASCKEEVLSTHPSTLSPEMQPDGRISFDKANEMIAIAFEKGSNRFEWMHRRLDGEDFPVEVTLLPVPLSGKEVLHCMWKDITEQKEKEAYTRKVQKRFKDVALHSADWIWEVDANGCYTYVSDRSEEILGYTPEEILGKSPFDLMPPEESERVSRVFLELVGERKPIVDLENWNLRKDGKKICLLTRGVPMVNDKGDFLGYRGVDTDITERKNAEQDLIKARHAAEAASQAKSDFLASMSHEIRTPMNGIIGMTSLLFETKMTAEQQEFAETIRNSADSLLSLINDILDFSKIEAGKMDLEYIDFNLQTLIDNVADLIAFKAVEKGLALSCYLHPSIFEHVNGDPGRVRQVLLNLAGNAIKFTEQGEIIISAEKAYENDTHVVVRFSVRDTGIGIPKKAMNKLFQSFSQVDASTTRKYGGSGLGLAISKKLVSLMCGEIHIESEENKGSTFWFMMPFAKQQEIDALMIEKPDFSGLRVLVADGHETSRHVLKIYLEALGCKVQEAGNTTEALATLNQATAEDQAFEIVIIDKVFPEMCGCELAEWIKGNSTIKETALILLSSSTEREYLSKIKKSGFITNITKPVKAPALYNAICKATGREPLQVDDFEVENEHPDSEDRQGTERKRAKILLAEDNIVNQKVAVKMLDKLGYHAECVANGEEAVAAVQSFQFDLILMDCQMPVMDGYEATRVIRSCETEKQGIPIIAMTANAMKGDRKKCLASGMDDYISKPVKKQVLEEKLRHWVKDTAGARE